MKILQVTEFFTPGTGGSTQVVYQLSRHLAQHGHQVTVCTSNFGRNKAQFSDILFPVIRFSSLPTRWKFYVTPGLILWIRNHLNEFDIIHLHNVRTFQNAVVAAQARRLGIPYVLSAHGSLPYLIGHHTAKRVTDALFSKRLIHEASRLIAVSDVEVKHYLDNGIPRKKVAVIHNGLDLEEFKCLPPRRTFRSKYNISDQEKMILFLGRLHVRKGINHLIEAIVKLMDLGINLVLIIIGPDDGELHPLQEMVNQLGLNEHVIFSGPLFGFDKLAAYTDADVLVSPGVHEIFGLVPFEALMCDTPVLVTDDSGLGQLISKAQAGYTVPYGNIEALTGAICHILSNPCEAKQKTEAGRRFIREHLDWENITLSVEHLYYECLL